MSVARRVCTCPGWCPHTSVRSHDWLRTFLPHTLAKVNRVSYGLLGAADCAAALEEDPNVPRSRLKLAVPFVSAAT